MRTQGKPDIPNSTGVESTRGVPETRMTRAGPGHFGIVTGNKKALLTYRDTPKPVCFPGPRKARRAYRGEKANTTPQALRGLLKQKGLPGHVDTADPTGAETSCQNANSLKDRTVAQSQPKSAEMTMWEKLGL